MVSTAPIEGILLQEKRSKKAQYQQTFRDNQKRKLEHGGDGDWNEFQEHVRLEALRSDAPAAVMGIYKEMLKLAREMKKDKSIGADELARRNLQADKELREGGYLS